MGKGYNGETCAEAIRQVVAVSEPAWYGDVFEKVRCRGTWADDTIHQQMMQWTVNLPPAYLHWPRSSEKFLFLRSDGLYELYRPRAHGVFDRGRRVDVDP
jgi:hypothetical protein